MPDGPGWVGHWSTNLGTVELVATTDLDVAPELREQRAADPFAGRYALDRDGARVEGALTCNAPTDNRLYCTWDLSEDVEGSAARGQQVMADPLQSPRVGS